MHRVKGLGPSVGGVLTKDVPVGWELEKREPSPRSGPTDNSAWHQHTVP